MNKLVKTVLAAALMTGGSVAVSQPAAAQTSFGVWVGSGPGYYGYRGYRGDRHYRHYRGYDDRRWRRGYRTGWRGYDRRRCWREWRYDPWRDREVRVRICR